MGELICLDDYKKGKQVYSSIIELLSGCIRQQTKIESKRVSDLMFFKAERMWSTYKANSNFADIDDHSEFEGLPYIKE